MGATQYNVIKYEGGRNDVIVYKSQITDFNTESVLIVDESQQALLYKDGQAEGPFKSGRYVLPTNNIPKFRGLFAKLFSRRKDGERDGSTPFSCDVFFVNMVNDISVQWGTNQRFPVKDPVYRELVNVGANGSVKVKVSDAMRFVVSMVGRMTEYTLDRIAFTIRSDIMTVIKNYIAESIVNCGVSLLEIQTKLLDLSQSAERRLNSKLEDYGLSILHFNIEDISIDEASQGRLLERQRKINAREDVVLDTEAQTKADYHRTVTMADAKAREREIQGYSYQDEQYWKAQQTMAGNPGYMMRGMIPGMPPYPGMPYPGMGYPGMYPGMAQGMPNQYYGSAPCPNCGNPVPQNSAFCPNCGNRVQAGQQGVQQGMPQQQAPNTHSYQQTAEKRNCPKCGFPLTPRTTVCPGCDYDLTEGDK